VTGNDQQDLFALAGGTWSGSVDGQGQSDYLFGDSVPNAFSIDGANSGTANGINSGFENIENLIGGSDVDTFTISSTGSLLGNIFGSDGDDLFLITPDLGATFSVSGGTGTDELVVDAQIGVPTEIPGAVQINPGGATITFVDVETITLQCATCAVALNEGVPVAAVAAALTAEPAASKTVEEESEPMDIGHFSSSAGLRIGFPEFFEQLARTNERQARNNRVVATDEVFAELDEMDKLDEMDEINEEAFGSWL
jgi:hypothetical protein